jgi:hypothetical protein
VVRPRSCSLRRLYSGASSDHCSDVASSYGRHSGGGVSGEILWSGWCKDVKALRGHLRCHK